MLATGLVLGVVAGCGPSRPLELPGGAGAPEPAAATRFDAATRDCRAVSTLSAEVALSGRLGGTRVRGRLLIGMTREGSLRLEGLAPFGAPVFVLVAREGEAVLLLPREGRVVQGATVAQLLDALAGFSLEARDLFTVVTGCAGAGDVVAGETFPGGWLKVTLQDGQRVWLRAREGQPPRLMVVERPDLVAEYTPQAGTATLLPAALSLRGGARPDGPERTRLSLVLRFSQAETNAAIDARAFDVAVPGDLRPMTLDELRLSSPLAR